MYMFRGEFRGLCLEDWKDTGQTGLMSMVRATGHVGS